MTFRCDDVAATDESISYLQGKRVHGRAGRNRPDPYMLVIEIHDFIELHVVTDDILRSSPLYRIRNPSPWKKIHCFVRSCAFLFRNPT
jgi:hypothetical protein